MKIHIEVLQGVQALVRCATTPLLEQWAALADQDPRLTVIQEPAFVLTWHRQ